jgi:adenylate cyclase
MADGALWGVRRGTRRGRLAGLIADVVAYGQFAGADKDLTLACLRGLRSDLIDLAIIGARYGRIVKRTGDAGSLNSVASYTPCSLSLPPLRSIGLAQRDRQITGPRRSGHLPRTLGERISRFPHAGKDRSWRTCSVSPAAAFRPTPPVRVQLGNACFGSSPDPSRAGDA